MKNVKFKNRIKAVSLFANVGIAETYFDDLGIDVVVANELLEERGRSETMESSVIHIKARRQKNERRDKGYRWGQRV